MKFKAGDEVFIKAEITDVSGYECSERPYFVAPDIYSVNWVSEDKIILMDKTYEDGLKDAWELAKKILKNRKPDEICELFNCLGVTSTHEIFENLTAAEALAKIEAYEKEKSEIKVGDVVEYKNTLKAVVTRIENCEEVYVLWGDGSCGKLKKNEVLKKGKTAEGLTDLLRQKGE